MSFYKEVPGRKTTLESTLKFDTTPTADSTNPVTSDGVNTAITDAVGDASEVLQEQIDDIAEKAGSGYIPKGEATVATLNGLTGQENGWLYTMTDAGTLTDGTLAVVAGDTVAWDATNSVWYKAMDYAPAQYGTNEVHNLATTITAFRTGDVILVDGPDGTAKMAKGDLLRLTAENTLNKETDNSDTSGHVDFKNDDETETYASIGSDGVSAKDFKDMAGVSVYDRINAIATAETDNADANEFVDFASDDEQEVYVHIDKNGLSANGFFVNGKQVINRVLTVAPSGADYTSLTEAIVEACKVKDTEVRVANGTYDIQAEYKALYGNNFFDNMTSAETNLGICLRNGVKLKFDSRAYVVFEYEGANNYVMDLFSPFTLDSYRTAYNFEIEGLKIKAKNCRYIVHDEMGTMAYPYTHVFKNCEMELDNTASAPKPAQPTFHYTQCIGGGLGKYGNIVIEGCKFNSKDFENASGSAVSYHNSSASGAQSVLNVSDNYFYGGGTFRLSWYGPSTLITAAFVGNNRLGSAIIHNAENSGIYDIHNTNVLGWNNQIGD